MAEIKRQKTQKGKKTEEKRAKTPREAKLDRIARRISSLKELENMNLSERDKRYVASRFKANVAQSMAKSNYKKYGSKSEKRRIEKFSDKRAPKRKK